MVFLTRRKGFVSSINEEVCLDEKEEIILYCLKMREDIYINCVIVIFPQDPGGVKCII